VFATAFIVHCLYEVDNGCVFQSDRGNPGKYSGGSTCVRAIAMSYFINKVERKRGSNRV